MSKKTHNNVSMITLMFGQPLALRSMNINRLKTIAVELLIRTVSDNPAKKCVAT